jgi:hypothetical protein
MKAGSNWSLAKKLGEYYLWSRKRGNELVWQVTIKGKPPHTPDGYPYAEIEDMVK